MSGIYNGLQMKIKSHSKNAFFIPCAAHALNLVGNSVSESCLEASHFFDFIQNLFVFFSSSKRWDLLKKANSETNITLKRISDTRWSTRADGILAVRMNFFAIIEALFTLCNDSNEKPLTELETKKLYDFFEDFETTLILFIWHSILQQLNVTNKNCQNKDSNLQHAVNLLKSLSLYTSAIQGNNEFFYAIETKVYALTGSKDYKSNKVRSRKRKLHFDEKRDQDVQLTGTTTSNWDCLTRACCLCTPSNR
jgi:hypothetical protein